MASYAGLFDNPLYSDVRLHILDAQGARVVSVHGHKELLSLASPFFEGMFKYAQPSNSIDIHCCADELPLTVKHALRLLYDWQAPEPPDISRLALMRRIDYFQLDKAAAKLFECIGDWQDGEIVDGYRTITTLAPRAYDVQEFWGPPTWQSDQAGIDDVRTAVLAALYRSTSEQGGGAYGDVLSMVTPKEMQEIASVWNRRVAAMDDDLVLMLNAWPSPGTAELDAALQHVRTNKLSPVSRQIYMQMLDATSRFPQAYAEFLREYCGMRQELPECRYTICPHDNTQIVRAGRGTVPEWLGLHVATDGDSLYVSAGRKPVFVDERFGWDTQSAPFNMPRGITGPVRVSYTVLSVRGTETGTNAAETYNLDASGELFLSAEHGFSAIDEVCDISHMIDDHIDVAVRYEVSILSPR